jgi:uncharacterized protein (DUF608 family)
VVFANTEEAADPTFGTAALFVGPNHAPAAIKAMWFRGGWFDSISALWREVSTGAFHPNTGSGDADLGGRNGGSILLQGELAPGESATYPIILAWHFPNVAQSFGVAGGPSAAPPTWQSFYAAQWSDAEAVAGYVRENLNTLRERTGAFQAALFSSTLPPYVIDAVASNLAILKSPTVLRQSNGNVWGWEGCFVGSGCCHGTCTHVWNYAQALPHLFPALERTLREQEYLRSIDGRGHVNFRAALPDAPTTHDFMPPPTGSWAAF